MWRKKNYSVKLSEPWTASREKEKSWDTEQILVEELMVNVEMIYQSEFAMKWHI